MQEKRGTRDGSLPHAEADEMQRQGDGAFVLI